MPNNLEDLNNSCNYNSQNNGTPPNNPASNPIVYPPDVTNDNSSNDQSGNQQAPQDDAETEIIKNILETTPIQNNNYNLRILDTNNNNFYPYTINNYRDNFLVNPKYDKFNISGYLTIDGKLQNTGLTEGYYYVTFKCRKTFQTNSDILFQDDRLFRVTKDEKKVFGFSYLVPPHGAINFEINSFTNINSATTVFTKGDIKIYGYISKDPLQ